eukprot:scaffold57386_cov66-Cyclotella_meneghiniana.AAC.1
MRTTSSPDIIYAYVSTTTRHRHHAQTTLSLNSFNARVPLIHRRLCHYHTPSILTTTTSRPPATSINTLHHSH